MEDPERLRRVYMLAIAQHEVDVLNLNIAEHCYSWCCSMADGYDMKTLVTWTIIINIKKHKFSVKFKSFILFHKTPGITPVIS